MNVESETSFSLRICYRGTDLHGCEEQTGLRTVRGELRSALERLGQTGADIDILSRTDAGVHAWDQHVYLDLPRATAPAPLLHGLARQLPADLRPLTIAPRPVSTSILHKTYVYLIDQSLWGDPSLAWAAWRPPSTLDQGLLTQALALLPGRHDWTPFRRRDETRSDLIRELQHAKLDSHGSTLRITLTATGFIHHLARSLVGSAVAVARGSLSLSQLREAVAGVPSDVTRQQAPAHGLHLVHMQPSTPPAWMDHLSGETPRGPWNARD